MLDGLQMKMSRLMSLKKAQSTEAGNSASRRVQGPQPLHGNKYVSGRK